MGGTRATAEMGMKSRFLPVSCRWRKIQASICAYAHTAIADEQGRGKMMVYCTSNSTRHSQIDADRRKQTLSLIHI